MIRIPAPLEIPAELFDRVGADAVLVDRGPNTTAIQVTKVKLPLSRVHNLIPRHLLSEQLIACLRLLRRPGGVKVRGVIGLALTADEVLRIQPRFLQAGKQVQNARVWQISLAS